MLTRLGDVKGSRPIALKSAVFKIGCAATAHSPC